jgi:hypothetical protein
MAAMNLLKHSQTVKAEPWRRAHFVNCIRDECEESVCGMCGRGRYEGIGISDLEEFPEDGKCLYPFFDLYDEGLDKLGAYEIGEAA